MNSKRNGNQEVVKYSFQTIFLKNFLSTMIWTACLLVFMIVAFTPVLLMDFGVITSLFGKTLAIAWTSLWFLAALVAVISWTNYEEQDKPERPSNYYY